MDLETARSNYQNANNDVASMQTDAPSMLQTLKSNLVGIFAKDNPLIQSRDQALSKYLSVNDETRASLLPSNQANVEGSPLNFSPTQQNAIVSGRQSAALAPLLGLNQLVTGQLGNIGDIVKNAGDIYSSSIDAGKTRANSALDLYKMLYQEQQDKLKGNGGLEGDLSAILSSILGGQTGSQSPGDLSSLIENDSPEFSNVTDNGMKSLVFPGQSNNSTPPPANRPLSDIYPISRLPGDFWSGLTALPGAINKLYGGK